MLERLFLFSALGGVMWLIYWLIRKERAGGAEEIDNTPFAMRLASDFEQGKSEKKNRRV